MTLVHRVLTPEPITSLDDYLTRRGGRGLDVARQVEPQALIDEIEASGLRGRGGAGFPTHIKWRTVAANRSDVTPTTVVVNGAEGEPGTFKDRTILRNDPYQVIEGALIAARAVGAPRVIFALKATFGPELDRLRSALVEVTEAGWPDGVALDVFEGPGEYLYGEETAMLEAIEGRAPFPRVAPPFRRGVDGFGGPGGLAGSGGSATDPESSSSARIEMAGPEGESSAPPALVDNVETMANVGRIIARGGAWFRTEGTDASPGTIVCTVTGSSAVDGVGEIMMGTTLREAIDLIGGGARAGRRISAVLPGVSNALIPASALDTPLTYEDMAAIGSGLGSAGFIVFDEEDDVVAAVAGASRFLAVESCGQCRPCKQDGAAIAEHLDRLCRHEGDAADISFIEGRLGTIADGARCYLATQHQVVVGSLLSGFRSEVDAHVARTVAPVWPWPVAELVDIEGTAAVIDERHATKQLDWTYGTRDSGQSPAERLDDHRIRETPPAR
jgi:NADH-quinone oxidoreductase subunit F